MSYLARVVLISAVWIFLTAGDFKFFPNIANASAANSNPSDPDVVSHAVVPLPVAAANDAYRQPELVEKIISANADPLVSEFLGVAEIGGFPSASLADIEFLLEVLSLGTPQGFSEKEWHIMQSRSLGFLVERCSQRYAVESRLLTMLADTQVTEFVRSDIVARSDVMYENSEQPKDIETLLWEMIESEATRNAMARIALASLSRISHRSNTIDTLRLNAAAVSLLNSQQASDKDREVAKQVVDWLLSHKVYHRAVNVLQNQAVQAAPVRLAAINTIRLSGHRDNIPLLQAVAQSENPLLSRAAQQAISELAN